MNFKATHSTPSFPTQRPKGVIWKRAAFGGSALGNEAETSGIKGVILETRWKPEFDEMETSPQPAGGFIELQVSVERGKRHV
jgi:hypothetical protein